MDIKGLKKSNYQSRGKEPPSINHRRGLSSLRYQLGLADWTLTKELSRPISTGINDRLIRTERLA